MPSSEQVGGITVTCDFKHELVRIDVLLIFYVFYLRAVSFHPVPISKLQVRFGPKKKNCWKIKCTATPIYWSSHLLSNIKFTKVALSTQNVFAVLFNYQCLYSYLDHNISAPKCLATAQGTSLGIVPSDRTDGFVSSDQSISFWCASFHSSSN